MGDQLKLNIGGVVDIKAGDTSGAEEAVNKVTQGLNNAKKAADSVTKSLQLSGAPEEVQKTVQSIQSYVRASKTAVTGTRMFGAEVKSVSASLKEQALVARQTAEATQRAAQSSRNAFRQLATAIATSDTYAKDYLQQVQTTMAARLAGVWAALRYARQASTAMEQLDMLRASLTRMQGQAVANELMEKGTEIAYKYGASVTDVTKTIAELTRQGRSSSDIKFLAESMAQTRLLLATSTGELLPMSKMIEHVTVLMNQLNISAREAARGVALMAELDIRTASSLDKIGNAVAKFAATGKLARMTMEEIILAATAFTEVGFTGEQAGTALNTILSRVGRNTEALAFMRQFGVGLTTLKDGAYAANSSMNMLVQTYTKLKETGRYLEMREFLEKFSGTRMQSKLVAGLEAYIRQTAPDTGAYTQIIEQMAQNDALAQQKRIDAMNTMLDTIGEKRVQLQNAFNEMFVTSEFISFYKTALVVLTDVSRTFATLVTTATRGIVGAIGLGDVEAGLMNIATLLQMYLYYKIPATIIGGIKFVTANSIEALENWARKIDENMLGIRYDDSAKWGEGMGTTVQKLGKRVTEAHKELSKLTHSFNKLPTAVQGAEYSLYSLWTGAAQAMDQYAASVRATTVQIDELVQKSRIQPVAQATGTPMNLLATFSPQDTGEMTPEAAKKWLQNYALAVRNEMRVLKATLEATPMFEGMSDEYKTKFEEASRHIERVFDRTYTRIRRTAGKEALFDPTILKEQANEAFQQLMKADSLVKTIPVSWDLDMAKAESAKMMQILNGELQTFSTLFGKNLSETVPGVISTKISNQIAAAEKAFDKAQKDLAQMFAKNAGNLVDPSAMQQIIVQAVEPIQAVAETVGKNMNAMLSQHVLPTVKRDIGELEKLLVGLQQKLSTPGMRRSPMLDIFKEQVTILEANKLKADELMLTLQKLPRNADPAVLVQKLHGLANILEQSKNEAKLLDNQMQLAMRSWATKIAETGARLLNTVNIFGAIVSAVALVTHWVTRLRDAWVDARIELAKYKEMSEDIAKSDQWLAESVRETEKLQSDYSGSFTEAEESLGDLFDAIDAVSAGLSEASQKELITPGTISSISEKMVNAGVIWFEVLKKQAGLIEGDFSKMDQALLEAVTKWNDSVQGMDLKDEGTAKRMVTEFMRDVLQIPGDVIEALRASDSPQVVGAMERFSVSLLGMATQAQDGAEILSKFAGATSQTVISVSESEAELATMFQSLQTAPVQSAITSAIAALQGGEESIAQFTKDAEASLKGWVDRAAATGGMAPATAEEATYAALRQLILETTDPEHRATLARAMTNLLTYLQSQDQNVANLVSIIKEFPESIGKRLFIETWASFQGETGTESSKKKATSLIGIISEFAQSKLKQSQERGKVTGTIVTSDATVSGALIENNRLLKRGETLTQKREEEQMEFNQRQIDSNNQLEGSFKMSTALTAEMNGLLKQTRDQLKFMRDKAKETGVNILIDPQYKQLSQMAVQLQNAISAARVSPASSRVERDAIRQLKDEYEAQKAAIDAYFTYREDAMGNIIDMQDRTKTPEAFEAHLANLQSYVAQLESLSTRGTTAFRAQVHKELEKANLERKKTIKLLEDAKLDIINEAALTKINLLNLRLQETGARMGEISKSQIFAELASLNLGVVLNQLQQAGSSTETYSAVAGLFDRIKASEQDATLSVSDRATLYGQMVQTVEDLLATESTAVDLLNPKVIKLLQELRRSFGGTERDFQALASHKASIALKITLDTQEAMDQLANWTLQKDMKLSFDGRLDASGISNRLEAIRTDMHSLIQQVIADNKTNSTSTTANLQDTFDQLRTILTASIEREAALQQTAADAGLAPILSSRQIGQVTSDRLDPAALQNLVKYYMQSALDQLQAAGVTATQIEQLDTAGLEETLREQLLNMIHQFIDSLRRAHDELVETIRTAWEDGFNIGFEQGFTPEGWNALKDSLIRRIGSTVSSYLSQYLSEVIADGIAEAFANVGGAAGGLGKVLGGLMGSIIGEVVGFFIGGLFNQVRDQAESMAEQQRKAQKDQVTSSGFNWSYREAEKATPYYEFSPPVTQESVKIVKFVNNFSITTDAAMAMISQQRELERVISEIITNMNRTLAKTTGLIL